MLDFDDRYDRDQEREPVRTARTRPAWVATGSLRQHFVCSSDKHEAMKLSPDFSSLPAPRRGAYIVWDLEDGSPAELQENRNCSCGSTMMRVADKSNSPTWAESLRRAGL